MFSNYSGDTVITLKRCHLCYMLFSFVCLLTQIRVLLQSEYLDIFFILYLEASYSVPDVNKCHYYNYLLPITITNKKITYKILIKLLKKN